MPFFSNRPDLLQQQILQNLENNPEKFMDTPPTDLSIARQILEAELGSNTREIDRCLDLITQGKIPIFPRDQNPGLNPFKPTRYHNKNYYDLKKYYNNIIESWKLYVDYSTPRSNYRKNLTHLMENTFPRIQVLPINLEYQLFALTTSFELENYRCNLPCTLIPNVTIPCSETPVLDEYFKIKILIFEDYSKYRKIITLQRWWKDKMWNPESPICQKWVAKVQAIFDANKK